MNGINLPSSLHNLPLMDRQQQEIHRTPVDHQEQNAAISREESARRATAPVEPDTVEGKNIDPDERRENAKERRKRKKKDDDNQNPPRSSTDSGHFIDLSA